MTPIDEQEREAIQALLRLLRSWHPAQAEATLDELVDRFGLPELVIRRIADSEGFALGVPDEIDVDPNTITQPIDFKRGKEP